MESGTNGGEKQYGSLGRGFGPDTQKVPCSVLKIKSLR